MGALKAISTWQGLAQALAEDFGQLVRARSQRLEPAGDLGFIPMHARAV